MGTVRNIHLLWASKNALESFKYVTEKANWNTRISTTNDCTHGSCCSSRYNCRRPDLCGNDGTIETEKTSTTNDQKKKKLFSRFGVICFVHFITTSGSIDRWVFCSNVRALIFFVLVAIGTPIVVLYVYGIIPFTIMRTGGCGYRLRRGGSSDDEEEREEIQNEDEKRQDWVSINPSDDISVQGLGMSTGKL